MTPHGSTNVLALRARARRTAPAVDLKGAGTIFWKELLEWFRTRRFLVTTVVATLIMVVIPVGVWIVDHDGLTQGRATLTGIEAADVRGGIATLLSLSTYLGILVTMGMLVKERETGTAQWVFTKPVSRSGYGLAKWAANSIGVVLATVLVPAVIAEGLIAALYDVPDWSWMDQIFSLGLIAIHVPIVVALMLLLGTLFRSTIPLVATALGLSVAPAVVAPIIGSGFLRMLPVFGLRDLMADVANGQSIAAADFMPLIAGLIFLPICLGIAGRR